ncbi:tetratricopeptide repeat protein [Gloeothece verrucosa]|uniref:Tetratricopeptide TPR_2 repeat protein n=1 Tax=Gloeothece verrucosa (strain PCC 7822) TaxID=497965 RepID=E0UJZ2_GLOV7|nr:tetratricopeptide repeat protein [Gloeothece verrucosa]ADN14628.1 Tetratricopeptide TPR_2 repeat protein [Gloeothece verrucosa PCC 7822]
MVSLLVAVPLVSLPMAARYYLMQGDRFLQQQQISQAIEAYSTAIRFQANFATVYLRLGKALQKNQQFQEALIAYDKAFLINPRLNVEPELAKDLNRLGVALSKENDLLDAITAYQRAVSVDPLLIEAQNNLGEALLSQEEWQEASQVFAQIIQFDPENAAAYTNLGNAFFQGEQWSQASEAYEKALELKPQNATILDRYAQALVKLERFQIAENIYLKAITLAPNRGDLYNGLGEVLYQQQKIPEAIAAYQQALRLGPKKAVIYKNLCYARHTQRQYEEALKLCRQARALDPSEGGAKFYIQEVERTLAIYKNPQLLKMPERIPSRQRDPLIALKRSIVKIIVKTHSYRGIGTGWLVKREGKKGWIVTNRHVITNSEQKEEENSHIEVEFYSQPLAGEVRRRKAAKIWQKTAPNDGLDLAVLEVSNIPQDIQPLSLSGEPPPIASKITVIGNPITGDDWSVALGAVQSTTDQALFLSVSLAPGNSGGPVLNSNEQVIGVVVKAGLFCPQPAVNTPMNLSLNKLGCGVAFPMPLVQARLKNWGL